MNWRAYQNELMVLAAFVFMLIAYIYKSSKVNEQTQNSSQVKQVVGELKEVVALKEVWPTRKIDKKLKKLEALIPKGKVQWSKRGEKITASFKGLSGEELNALTTKILNLPIVVRQLEVKKIGRSYDVEFKCKW